MKKIFITAIAILSSMMLIPLIALKKSENTLPVLAPSDSSYQLKETEKSTNKTVKVYNPETGGVTELNWDEYIFGVVAAEMPALYHEEALKAQAVAAYTFAVTRKAENTDKDYDITSSPLTDQSFITKEAAAQKWGENASVYTEKIKKAIDQTNGLIITYNKKPITAVYHALSSGKTESSADIWGTDIPYLVPVPSEDDTLAENYCSTLSFTSAQLAEYLKLSSAESLSFAEAVRTQSGSVKEISVGDKTFSGSEIRELLNLRSSNFTVTQTDDNFTFTVYGYGHGVGMSQHGANKMAEKGSGFKEILMHYYKGCEIENIL